MNKAVHYRHSLSPQAGKIRCEVCQSCEWVGPSVPGRCVFGGPYAGYRAGEQHVTLTDLLARFDPAQHRHELMLDDPPVGTETGSSERE